jgi:hypothetical protein
MIDSNRVGASDSKNPRPKSLKNLNAPIRRIFVERGAERKEFVSKESSPVRPSIKKQRRKKRRKKKSNITQ